MLRIWRQTATHEKGRIQKLRCYLPTTSPNVYIMHRNALFYRYWRSNYIHCFEKFHDLSTRRYSRKAGTGCLCAHVSDASPRMSRFWNGSRRECMHSKLISYNDFVLTSEENNKKIYHNILHTHKNPANKE